jgi:acyl-CoA synthetase (AMP-forming)/AMP-acid ligase II
MTLSPNLGSLIDRSRAMDKIAIIDFDGTKSRDVTYAQLDALADGIARALTKRGYKRGDRIAILSANSSDCLAAHFGIMRAGFVSVPINHRLPRKTVDYIIQDSGAPLVFCDNERRAVIPDGIAVVNFDTPEYAAFSRLAALGGRDAACGSRR